MGIVERLMGDSGNDETPAADQGFSRDRSGPSAFKIRAFNTERGAYVDILDSGTDHLLHRVAFFPDKDSDPLDAESIAARDKKADLFRRMLSR